MTTTLEQKKPLNRYELGLKGQNWIENKFENFGYSLYKRNLKCIGLELDLILFKYIEDKNLLLIRIIEVKTRGRLGEGVSLENLNIQRKWVRVKKIMFNLPDEIKNFVSIHQCKHSITFDLAVILHREERFSLHKYIQNVNLLL